MMLMQSPTVHKRAPAYRYILAQAGVLVLVHGWAIAERLLSLCLVSCLLLWAPPPLPTTPPSPCRRRRAAASAISGYWERDRLSLVKSQKRVRCVCTSTAHLLSEHTYRDSARRRFYLHLVPLAHSWGLLREILELRFEPDERRDGAYSPKWFS